MVPLHRYPHRQALGKFAIMVCWNIILWWWRPLRLQNQHLTLSQTSEKSGTLEQRGWQCSCWVGAVNRTGNFLQWIIYYLWSWWCLERTPGWAWVTEQSLPQRTGKHFCCWAAAGATQSTQIPFVSISSSEQLAGWTVKISAALYRRKTWS